MFGGVDKLYYKNDFIFLDLIQDNPYYSVNVIYYYFRLIK